MIHLILGVFTLLTWTTKSWAQYSTPPGVSIQNWQLSGDGCKKNEVSVSLSPDAQELSLLFDSYVAEVGPASDQPRRTELVKNCRIIVQMDVPKGWQMAFHSVDYRGYASLPQVGSSAFHRISVVPQGSGTVSLREATMTGPMNDDYYLKAEVSPHRLTWSNCMSGRAQVHLLSQLGVRINPRAPALSSNEALTIALDSSDLSIKQSLGVHWRPCSLSGGGNSGRTPPQAPPRPPRYRP